MQISVFDSNNTSLWTAVFYTNPKKLQGNKGPEEEWKSVSFSKLKSNGVFYIWEYVYMAKQ